MGIHKKYKKQDHSQLISILVLSTFFTIYFNFLVFYQLPLVHLIVTFIHIFSMIFLIFTIISFNRMMFLFFYIFTILVFSYTFFFANFYNLYPSTRVLKIIIMLDINEFLGSLDIFVIIYILFSIFVALLVLKYFNVYNMPFWQYARNLMISLFLILITSIAYNISLSAYVHKYQVGKMSFVEYSITPMNIYRFLLRQSIFYLLPHNYEVKSVDHVANHTRYKNEPYEGLNIILVIGETSRKINWSLNGYERFTNPKLSKIKNLVYFKNFFSIDTYTSSSCACILSMERCDTVREEMKKYIRNLEFTPFVELFHHLGYETYLFSNVPICSNEPRNGLLSSLQNKYIISEKYSDHKLLHLLTEFLLQENSQKKSNKFFIIQTLGSHSIYNTRYTKEFEIFTPTCKGGVWPHYLYCDNQNLLNEYDNTILSTDDFLSNIIELFQDKKTVLIYVSDHGESLGEDGVYLHGLPYDIAPKEQIEVPAFIWFSNKFLEEFGTEVMELATQKVDKHMCQEYISHSILDCAFIASDIIDTKKSFCAIN